MKKIIGLLIAVLFVNLSLIAQIDKEKAIKPRHELKIADLLYAQSFYYSATEYYKEVVRQKPDNRYAKYWLAMSCLKSADYPNALKYFKSFDEFRFGPKVKMKRVEKENVEIYGLSDFYYGQALKHNELYEEAIEKLNKFKASYVLDDKELWFKLADKEIEGAEWALANPNKKKVKVNSLGEEVNSGYEEAGPMPLNDSTIYYTSINKDQMVFVNQAKEIPRYNLYQSSKVNGVWGKGKKLPESFQDAKFGTGNSAISDDGNRIYFCKCFNNEIDEIICNLYLTEKVKDRWTEAVPLNSSINSPKYTSTQPSVRSTGNGMEIVYFVSDREGGVGGMDIWYFMRTARGEFKGPRLLQGSINTIGDELCPYYNIQDELLYFSSNGHPSIGGYDVFVCQEDADLGWSEPQNVGRPINSSADDLYFVREQGKTSGFLVSNREGTSLISNRYRGDDLYYFEDYKYGLEGFVYKQDKNGESPLDGATIRLYTTDLDGNDVLVEELENVKENYFFELKPDKEYKVEVVKAGFNSSFEYVSTMNLADEDTLNKNLKVDKSGVIATGSIYDDADSAKLKKMDNAVITLSEVLENGSLRQINTKKIIAENPDFFYGLDLNRNYQMDIGKDGYFKKTVVLSTIALTENIDTLFSDVFMTAIKEGQSYELDNILYDFGKATLRDESKVILDDLVAILKDNPGLIIELGAHTDNIGSDLSNLKLSQARAQSCVDYLISKGISSSRLSAKGYGEAMPLAPNENEDGSDNEAGRQKNRRTEFKVLRSF